MIRYMVINIRPRYRQRELIIENYLPSVVFCGIVGPVDVAAASWASLSASNASKGGIVRSGMKGVPEMKGTIAMVRRKIRVEMVIHKTRITGWECTGFNT